MSGPVSACLLVINGCMVSLTLSLSYGLIDHVSWDLPHTALVLIRLDDAKCLAAAAFWPESLVPKIDHVSWDLPHTALVLIRLDDAKRLAAAAAAFWPEFLVPKTDDISWDLPHTAQESTRFGRR
ncbi:hypothetical protein C8R46DRAFT_1212496 [Mycena filopes]|nr:hypothetical protein C8R46DRAFT_1212496 [Mycena filopes]